MGFSFPTARDSRVENIPNVYGAVRPPVLSFHLYETPADLLQYSDAKLDSLGMASTPIIVGETYYNDAGTAQSIASAAATANRTILFATQWPVTNPRSASNCGNVNVMPINFNNMLNAGF